APRLRTRLRAQLTHRPMAWLERHVIRRAALGLFHGQDTYDAYAAYARAAEVVHDVHVGAADAIGADALARKAAETEGPLRLVYAGRVEPMKGPMDWIAVLERLAADGIPVEATWIGEGSVLAALRARAAAAGLNGTVHFPGFVSDRSAMLAALRQAHALLFCHLTPESPRILIEALISGTPLLGYDGAFARGLIAGQGGGVLVARGDVTALTAAAAALAADPARRGALIRAAASDGLAFEDAKVFAHRSEVIFRHLGPETAALPSARPAVVAKST
ncbi:MAG: glycosyltransferase, partial [Pseudomonadota bacterium]